MITVLFSPHLTLVNSRRPGHAVLSADSADGGLRPHNGAGFAYVAHGKDSGMPENLVVGVIALGAGLLAGFVVALLVRRSVALNSETTARSNADRLLAEARTCLLYTSPSPRD